jgi:hypothetical protein
MGGNKVVGASEVRAAEPSRAGGDTSHVACLFPRPVGADRRVLAVEGKIERGVGNG